MVAMLAPIKTAAAGAAGYVALNALLLISEFIWHPLSRLTAFDIVLIRHLSQLIRN
jgi:hypothetical protein